ncbi:DUF2442 domain-containing protein [Anaerovorax odorimutans]|uniref:DUF2442 domain-containing protein n=1 Tax=Anaerovorax odorimutans TaxID=109327 RepID=A0ABT1RSA5_9FIRM|nr:DUF2442 domain-containing protein [Anaerovorax odorimutans]MCQ4638041.1 DUF2442 domain-containing protein [Anaerovorax odorimutans]
MLRPVAQKVVPVSDYQIMIEFDNGERKLFDVKPYIKGEWYEELGDESYFKSVAADGFTVCWPHGQDLCPDEIYFDSVAL